jgi:hypothetical protein
VGASERDEFLRAAWRLLFAGRVDAERLVFVDEMGANVSLSPLYVWSRRGLRAYAKAPRNWGKNVTLLASITHRGLGPCLAVEGSWDSPASTDTLTLRDPSFFHSILLEVGGASVTQSRV